MKRLERWFVDLYYRYTICRKYGHLWAPVEAMPDCERIYTSSLLDQEHVCLLCKKRISALEYAIVTSGVEGLRWI